MQIRREDHVLAADGSASPSEATLTAYAVYDAEDELKKLFNIRESSGWGLNIEPDTEPEGPSAPAPGSQQGATRDLPGTQSER